MLIIGIVLMLVGALVAYFGRPREQFIFWAGVIIFFVGLLLIIVWALRTADVNTNAAIGLPALAMRRAFGGIFTRRDAYIVNATLTR